VSVQSQADSENADRAREAAELEAEPAGELRELTAIYVKRGLTHELAHDVAVQLTAHDALGTHVRDELGLTSTQGARPVQAALASAGSFAVGAALPLAVAALLPAPWLIASVSATSLVFLALLGAVAARVGGSGMVAGAARVTFWGAFALAATAGVGKLFGATV
jgi:VIT1/CCC1 family predicted Fe2+/Mn2+ transporter